MSPGQAGGRERRSGESSSSQVDGWMGGRGAMKKLLRATAEAITIKHTVMVTLGSGEK